ncbi:MAG: magnesium transporter [Gammaproteobacteria bacterium]|nr:magnesium transporter [Gammaproteobacteria bacterium]MDH5802687.1 magnesium transporter [Gammaproteobacteria bacterium]
MTTTAHLKETAQLLTNTYLIQYPVKAAREIAKTPMQDAANFLSGLPTHVLVSLFSYIPAGLSEKLLQDWPHDKAVDLLVKLDVHMAATLLARLESELQNALLQKLAAEHKLIYDEFIDILDYPDDTAGRIMDTKIQIFDNTLTVEEVLNQIRMRHPEKMDAFFLRNKSNQLVGTVDIGALILAKPNQKVNRLIKPISHFLYALDPKDEVIEKFEGLKVALLPVLDVNDTLVGVIRDSDIYQQTKEDLASEMAVMVGASKDERALSSSWFAFRQRMPWLQINLLTAFAAAAVVGAFEGMIAKFTALAILLPVAAGQSGNAGAQALAVTMRGLTLKEITTRHWWQVLKKEGMVGFLNGVAIAITCSIGVWIWSRSIGLSLVMALSMIASLIIACASGALVPVLLKKFGLDPAQSSSIVLTTVTDIAGFASFLGIATLLSSMLPTG